MAEEGCPTVPHVSRFLRIPNTGGAQLVVGAAEFDVIDDVDAYPYQKNSVRFNQLCKNEALYAKDEWYPSDPVTVSQPMIMRDFRVVQMTLNPVQVNPVTHQARIYRRLSVDLVANHQPAPNELTTGRRPCEAWADYYRNAISNLDDGALDDATTSPGGLLIITSNNSTPKQWADSLAEWKTREGYRVVEDARPSWTAGTMTTVIRAAYASYDPPLEFVVLMGDPEVSWGVPIDGDNFDHTYALGNAGDDLEDIGVGRLSGSSGQASGDHQCQDHGL